jgi:hypothetical protein
VNWEDDVKVVLTKKQVKYILEKSGEQKVKKAFNMFLSCMEQEKISPLKMPELIDKMMVQDNAGKKE